VVERGQLNAAALGGIFEARKLSPLLGIYLPMIESEYVNLESANSLGALGMFQFLPATGSRYGLSKEELLDVNKSADAAARYLSDAVLLFNNDPMKEALALLAYNRGSRQVVQDLAEVLTKENEACSICALTAASSRLDQTFQNENVYYVPRFFAAAIVGENPSRFELPGGPLSTYR
jgi:membrane-bound lytic murein transglycosylase D